MNHRELAEKLSELIRGERKITNEILQLVSLVLSQRSYLELGYSSMFDWLTNGFGYSSSAAFRRIEAAKLLREIPEISEKLEDGRVNLTTVCKAQTLLKKQEKVSGQKVSLEKKQDLIAHIENKPILEAEQALLTLLPEAASELEQERHRVINSEQIRHQMNLSNKASADLKRIKELLSHKFPEATDAEVISFFFEEYLKKNDPLRKVTAVAAVEKSAKKEGMKPEGQKLRQVGVKALRFKIIQESQGQCTYRDPQTGKTCGSTFQVQLDHIVPKALGGSDHPSNLRVLCRQHNLLMAERVFGKSLIDNYRHDNL